MRQPRLFQASQTKNTISNYETQIHMKNHYNRLQKIKRSSSPQLIEPKINFKFPQNPFTKKQYLREKNQKDISTQNQRLIQKIKQTMGRKTDLYNLTFHRQKSLNVTSRKIQLQKINRQNQKIHKNLEGLKPIISKKKQIKQSLNNTKYLQRISKSQKDRLIDWSKQQK